MPVLITTAVSGPATGTPSAVGIAMGAIIPTCGLLAFLIFAWKRRLLCGWYKRVLAFFTNLFAPSPPFTPTTARGGVTFPTSTPRKWKAWRKTSAERELYAGVRAATASPPASPGAPAGRMRSVSTFSGVSEAGQVLPVVSIPPPVYVGRPPRGAALPFA